MDVSETLLARVGGSHEMLEEIIGLFLEDSPKLMEDIRKALAAGDAKAAYRGAHTLRVRPETSTHTWQWHSRSGSRHARAKAISTRRKPVRLPRTGDDRPSHNAGRHPGGTTMRILIAEDDRVTARILTGLLTRGATRRRSPDGESALELIAEQRTPQLALLDWMLPGMDGPEVCRRPRASGSTTPGYVILLTAKRRAGRSRRRTRRRRR